MSATRSIRRLAAHAVDEALGDALHKAFAESARKHPRSRGGTYIRAYLRAVRAWLERHPA
jgi:hypothetical protein